MGLNRITNFQDVFLTTCYSSDSGWSKEQDMKICHHQFDYVFTNGEGFKVLVRRLQEPYVSKKEIKIVKEVINNTRLVTSIPDLEVLLVCEELIFEPEGLPERVKLLSLVDEFQLQECKSVVKVPSN